MEIIYKLAFRLKDTKGLLYHEKRDAHAMLEYIAKIVADGGHIKGVAIETLDN